MAAYNSPGSNATQPTSPGSLEETLEDMHHALQHQMDTLRAKAEQHTSQLQRLEAEREQAAIAERDAQRRDFLEVNSRLAQEKRDRERWENEEAVLAERAAQEQIIHDLRVLQAQAMENQRRLSHNAKLDLEKAAWQKQQAENERTEFSATSLLTGGSEMDRQREIERKARYRMELQQQAEAHRNQRKKEIEDERGSTAWTSLPMRSRESGYEAKMRYRQELKDQIQEQQMLKSQQKGVENEREAELRRAQAIYHDTVEAQSLAAARQAKEEACLEAKKAAIEHEAARREAKAREQAMEAQVMGHSASAYAQEIQEKQARDMAQAASYHREIDLQVQYKKLVQDSQREMEKILSTMASTGLA